MNGRTAIERMRRVRVPEPVGSHGLFDSRPSGGGAYDSQNGKRLEPAAGFPFPRPKDRILAGGVRPSQTDHQLPNRRRNLNRAGDASLPPYSDLAAVSVGL